MRIQSESIFATFSANFAVGNLLLSVGKLQIPVPAHNFLNLRRPCTCSGIV